MKSKLFIFSLIFASLVLSCQNEVSIWEPESATNIYWRYNPCEGHSGITVGFSRDIASCKKDCERGFGFRCGGYNYTCSGSVMTSYTPVAENCPQSISGSPSNYSWTPMGTVLASDTSRRVHMLLEALSPNSVKAIFLSPLPSQDLIDYPYFEVESNTVRWEYSAGASFGSAANYHYFQFQEGDYPIITGTTPYGYVLLPVVAY